MRKYVYYKKIGNFFYGRGSNKRIGIGKLNDKLELEDNYIWFSTRKVAKKYLEYIYYDCKIFESSDMFKIRIRRENV